jgi:hypothetical protein
MAVVLPLIGTVSWWALPLLLPVFVGVSLLDPAERLRKKKAGEKESSN